MFFSIWLIRMNSVGEICDHFDAFLLQFNQFPAKFFVKVFELTSSLSTLARDFTYIRERKSHGLRSHILARHDWSQLQRRKDLLHLQLKTHTSRSFILIPNSYSKCKNFIQSHIYSSKDVPHS